MTETDVTVVEVEKKEENEGFESPDQLSDLKTETETKPKSATETTTKKPSLMKMISTKVVTSFRGGKTDSEECTEEERKHTMTGRPSSGSNDSSTIRAGRPPSRTATFKNVSPSRRSSARRGSAPSLHGFKDEKFNGVFGLKFLKGKSVDLSNGNFTGYSIVFSFSVPNCPACEKIYPLLDAWQTKWPQSLIMCLLMDPDEQRVADYMKSHLSQYKFSVGYDSKGYCKQAMIEPLEQKTVPFAFLIGPMNMIRYFGEPSEEFERNIAVLKPSKKSKYKVRGDRLLHPTRGRCCI